MLALREAIEIARTSMPAEEWDINDDLCDCTFQRIGYWTNPYLGETLEVRMCCIWKELYKQFPEFVRVTRHEPAEWNGETDMPSSLWHRQLANHLGISVADARAIAAEPPKGVKKAEPVPFVLLMGGQEIMLDLAKVRFR